MVRRDQKNSTPLSAESESMGAPARAELIKLIRHRLHEPLGPTLLVLQLLLREESLSPQGVALIKMLQRSIKEEVRAIHELTDRWAACFAHCWAKIARSPRRVLTSVRSFSQADRDGCGGWHRQGAVPATIVGHAVPRREMALRWP